MFGRVYDYQVLGRLGLGAEYLSPKKVNLLNYNRFILSPKRLKVTYSAPKFLKLPSPTFCRLLRKAPI